MSNANRAGVAVVAVFMIAMGILLAIPTIRAGGWSGQLVFTIIYGAVGLLLLCVSIWGYRRKSDAELGLAPLPADWPTGDELARCAVCKRLGLTGNSIRCVVDYQARKIYFENSHTPNRFLATAERAYSCSVDDLFSACEHTTKHGRYLLILTQTGKATIADASGYDKMVEALRSVGVPPVGGPETESGLMVTLAMLFGLLGALIGSCFTSIRMNTVEFYGQIAMGAVCGVLVAYTVVRLADTHFGLRLVIPLYGILLGGLLGSALGYMFQNVLDVGFLDVLIGRTASGYIWVLGTIGGVVIGAIVGGKVQSNRELKAMEILARRKKAILEV